MEEGKNTPIAWAFLWLKPQQTIRQQVKMDVEPTSLVQMDTHALFSSSELQNSVLSAWGQGEAKGTRQRRQRVAEALRSSLRRLQ